MDKKKVDKEKKKAEVESSKITIKPPKAIKVSKVTGIVKKVKPEKNTIKEKKKPVVKEKKQEVKKEVVVKKSQVKKVIQRKISIKEEKLVEPSPAKDKLIHTPVASGVVKPQDVVTNNVGESEAHVAQAQKIIKPQEIPGISKSPVQDKDESRSEVALDEKNIPLVHPISQDKVPSIPAAVVATENKTLVPLEMDLPISVKDLAAKIQQKSSVLIKDLIEKQKMFVTINQNLNEEIVKKVLLDFGFEYKHKTTGEDFIFESHKLDKEENLSSRPPIVTFMGHVDHGKTSLLDAIRRSKVAEKEHGGITQHIGAYVVKTLKGMISFLDTPGHEAFTAMRSRGANITDIVVLVVAADDGIMPQTIEAIDHAKAAGVPIIVAINKIDKHGVDIDKVKRQLMAYELMSEEWGGKTIVVGVSAKTGQGIDELLEMISLEAEMLELKAAYDRLASGVVIEARLSKEQGPMVTILVQEGTLKASDSIICGVHYGKIRAMFNDKGERIDKVFPGMPAEILGLSGLPMAGEKFYVLNDDKQIKEIISKRQEQEREKRLAPQQRNISLEDLYSKIQEGAIKELNLIIKADVQGSLEVIKESLAKLPSKEVKLNVLHCGIGSINSSDVILAEASRAIIIGFHVEAESKAKEMSDNRKVEIRTYRIIYELLEEMRAALEGLLTPRLKKVFLGRAEVRKVFNLTKSGLVAGCFVLKGKIMRQATANIVREGQVIFEGSISALKRFKDDVREVKEGFECGISLEGFTDYKEGDFIDLFSIEKIARTL